MLRLIGLLVLGGSVAGGAQIYARKMEILRTPEGQVTVLRDSVLITDRETRISAGRAWLNESQGVAVIEDSVRIETGDVLVQADSACYRLEERLADLFGDVTVTRESLLILAPRLTYSIPERQAEATAGLTVRSLGRRIRVSGDRGSYNLREEFGVVDSNPVLVREADEDSVLVTCSRMTWQARESKALAAGEVEVSSGRARMSCDTLVFFADADSGLAWGTPVVRDSVSRTTGDTVHIVASDGRLSRVAVVGNAVGRYTTESGEEVEVAGQTIRIEMEGGEVAVTEVRALTSGLLIRPREQAGG